jgi:hypothetical protein
MRPAEITVEAKYYPVMTPPALLNASRGRLCGLVDVRQFSGRVSVLLLEAPHDRHAMPCVGCGGVDVDYNYDRNGRNELRELERIASGYNHPDA